MAQQYFKLAIRSLLRSKQFAVINMLGLALGIMVAIITFWVIRFEKSFDNFHANAASIYQVRSHTKFGVTSSHVPQGIVKAAQTQVPGIAHAAAIYRWDPQVIQVNQQNLQQRNAFFVSPSFCHIIDLTWLAGSPETSLGKPNQVVLDEETARRLFPHEEPMGKTIRFDNALDLVVTGIIQKTPANSAFPLQMMISYESLKTFLPEFQNNDYWGGGDSYYQAYVLLKPDASPQQAGETLTQLALQHQEQSDYIRYDLEPLSAVHFDQSLDHFNYATPQWLLYSLGGIGLFILLIGCINFVNLATVQAVQRNKDIAMRKLLGSGKGLIISQFMLETAIVVLVSLIIGAGLATVFLPYAAELLRSNVNAAPVWTGSTLLYLLALFLLIVLVAALYPAIVLSGFKPIQVLRKQLSGGPVKGVSLRRALVAGQFIIAQVLVICMLIGIRQTRFLYQKDLGFDKEQVMTVKMPERDNDRKRHRLRDELGNHPGISDLTFGLTAPSSTANWWYRTVQYHTFPKGAETFRLLFIDSNYFRFFKIPVLAGRTLTARDTLQAVVNEKAVTDMGLRHPEQAIGQQLNMNGALYTIAGVVKDYHSQSLKEQIPPHIYIRDGSNFQTIAIRIQPGQTKAAVQAVEASWKKAFPDNYFSYSFLSEDIRSFYGNEEKFTRFLSIFAIIGIFIGCMGLYGLVSIICLQKVKEIGVRKVLGASSARILLMLEWDFFRMVILAFLVALPVSYFLAHRMLQGFAYRISISWWIFLLAFLATAVIALLTVGIKAIGAALINPVKNLRSE